MMDLFFSITRPGGGIGVGSFINNVVHQVVTAVLSKMMQLTFNVDLQGAFEKLLFQNHPEHRTPI